jgi:hypothetical protein
MLLLCSQPTADELSPNAKKHASFSATPFMIATHTEMTDATNSSKLFWCTTSFLKADGIWNLQAFPLKSYPPRPCGQASDQHMNDGRWKVIVFKLMPWLIFGRKW